KSTLAETWRVILVSSADIFLSKSLRILAERITQKGIVSPPEKVCDTPPIEEGDIHSGLYWDWRGRRK
ncbi:hypothetical protein, partial [Brotaphodocola sp.]|uniref:hypothetical protein n=1 Tax=Brotaphodocola sp. TaxID=3073577 RepID=UPI003D7E7CDE